MRRYTYLLILIIPLSTFFLCSCSSNGTTQKTTGRADSLIDEEVRRKNIDRVIALADSLESAHEVSTLYADLWRGWAFHRNKQYSTAEECYRKVLNANIRTADEKSCYRQAAGYLADLLYIKHDYEGALRIAVPVVNELVTNGEDDVDAMVMLLSSVGRCQMKLGRFDEASETFGREYQYNQMAIDSDTTGVKLKNALVHTANVAIRYLNAKMFPEAQMWLERTSRLLEQYDAHPGARKALVAEYHARLAIYSAFALENIGEHKGAEEAYQTFITTEYGKSDDGQIDACEYLIAAKRFDEAADNFRELDRMMYQWGYKLTLDNIEGYLLPKYRANVGCGRRDSAYAVALKICNALDSALVWQKNNDAAELATIYDTQQKEMTIARQQADLVSQRMIAVVIALVLVITFFIIYILYRRKVTRRLAEKNAQLEIANARAEESSKMKTNFIQQISHEIRTPLNILSGFTQIVTTPGVVLDDAARQDINRQITENTDRITGLVNKMLELSEASSTVVISRDDTAAVVRIAAQAVEDSGITNATHISFDLQVAPSVETMSVQTNLRSAVRALTLLLDNAEKFTRKAEAHHRNDDIVKREKVTLGAGVDGDFVAFTVEDTGIGIPAEEAEHIFDEFVQLDEYYDGTGIGLTVARSIARRLGGDIVLDTSYDSGARFVMTLPL